MADGLPSKRALRARIFTLVELLVVLAVIAVLASMLLPSLQQAKNRACQIACNGNLRQQITAMLMYASDHDGNVSFIFYPDEPAAQKYWDRKLSPYLSGDENTLMCPGCPDVYVGYAMSYGGLFGGMPYRSDREECAARTRLTVYESPDRTMCMLCNRPDDSVFRRRFAYSPLRFPSWWSMPVSTGNVGIKHNRGTNAAFLDGHVSWHNTTRLQADTAENRLFWARQ